MDFEKGQHFLNRDDIIKKEVELAEILDEECVLEIGGGSGNLTKELVKSCAKKVLCFEIDKEFFFVLKELEKDYDNLKVIFGNALDFSWNSFNKIVSNIPYHLSEAILVKAVSEEVSKMVLIVGKTFKKKLFSDTKISFLVKSFYDVKDILKIKGNDFSPVTKTDSWLLVFDKKKYFSERDIFFRELILFNGKIKNGLLEGFINRGLTKNEAKGLIKGFNLSDYVLNKKCSRLTLDVLKIIDDRINKNVF